MLKDIGRIGRRRAFGFDYKWERRFFVVFSNASREADFRVACDCITGGEATE